MEVWKLTYFQHDEIFNGGNLLGKIDDDDDDDNNHVHNIGENDDDDDGD